MYRGHNDWKRKYNIHPLFLASFETEQDFVDSMFIWMIYANFGILVTVEELLVTA